MAAACNNGPVLTSLNRLRPYAKVIIKNIRKAKSEKYGTRFEIAINSKNLWKIMKEIYKKYNSFRASYATTLLSIYLTHLFFQLFKNFRCLILLKLK